MLQDRNNISDGLESEPPMLGDRIRQLREERQLRQGDLAQRLGMSAAQLCHIEKMRNVPSVRTLHRIAEALGVPWTEFSNGGRGNPIPYGRDELVTEDCIREAPSPELLSWNLAKKSIEKAPVRPRKVSSSCKMNQGMSVGKVLPASPGANLRRSSMFFVVDGDFDLEPVAERTAEWMRRESFRELIEIEIKKYQTLVLRSGVPRGVTLPLNYPAQALTLDGAGAARALRTAGGVGQAVLFDPIGYFEGKGIPVLALDLPEELHSVSFWDEEAGVPYIVLNRNTTDERQQFCMACEIGFVVRKQALGKNKKVGTPADRRFARDFAAAFLMPSEAVQEVAYRLGRTPNNWTYELLLRAKVRFGVSAEAFAYRLESLDLLRSSLRREFVQRLHEYYESHGYAEPMPSGWGAQRRSRKNELELLAELED